MLKKILKFIGLGFAIALLMAFFVNRGAFLGLQKSLQNKFYDFASASPEIVIVAIDEKSLSSDELGTWQKWPREYYADAVGILNGEGAAVIGIDVTFPDYSINGEKDDKAFYDVLKDNKNVVLAARFYSADGKLSAELPNKTLLAADPAVGWINVKLDKDNFVRELPVFASTLKGGMEAFSLKAARLYMNAEQSELKTEDHHFRFSDDTEIPIMTRADPQNGHENYFMYINYFAEPGSYATISMADLLKKNFTDKKGNKVDFNEKIVLIGPTAIDLKDYYNSPVSQGIMMPGVEVHANNVQTVITGNFLRDQSDLSLWLTLILLIAANIFMFARLRVRFAIPIFISELFVIVVGGIVAYEYRIFLNVIYPMIAVILTFVGAFLLRFILEQSERKFIEGAFGHFVNKTVVQQILKDPKMLELGGAKRTVTAFFSDIAGFTSISEKMEPGKLVSFLNRYLGEMTNIILDHQGTLDKYEGDAIMAFWGAPIPQNDHAKNACMAALENHKKLELFREECVKQNLPPIYIRIGINSGEVIAGNMGSENRFDYTIMGDSVNLASRLEGINKQYGTEIMVSEFTYGYVKDDFVFRELDLIRVKGKEAPVRIYELIGIKEETPPARINVVRIYADALALYRQKDFAAAREKFQSIPDDPPSKVFMERCEEFLKNPPDEGWDGVYTFTTK